MTSHDIEIMLAEKGKACLSIIIPTKKFGHERQQNHELIDKAITREQILVKHSSWPKEVIQQLQERLKQIPARIEQIRLDEGLAIFISPNVFKIYSLPFPVTEKVMLGNSFEVRDLIYFHQFLRPYYLLAVSRQRVRLLKGNGRELHEVVNDDFPKRYVEEYEYERPSVGNSSGVALKSVEPDKSILSDTRIRTFFRSADEALRKYLKPEIPLFVAGVNEEIADFEKVSSHARQITGKIRGNYDVDAVHPLAEMAWRKLKQDLQLENRELLLKLDDAFGRHLAVDGIVNVWKAAYAGQGRTLMIEKDYVQRAFVKPARPDQLFLFPPVDKHEVLHDAGDDLIELVKEKGGNVTVVDNGDLKDFQQVALILRYANGQG
jgi:hypothetical protein